MRIVIVSNIYRPQISARAFRWSAIAEQWAAQGHRVEVVAGWIPGAPREEHLDGVRVFRVGGGLSERLRRRLTLDRPSAEPAAPGGGRARSRPSALRRAVRVIHDRVWRNVYWPDYACLWCLAASRRTRELLARRPCDVLVTSSLPFAGHVVGLRTRRAFPDLPWLADVGDPFCFLKDTPTNNHALYDRLNHRVEQKVFRRADAVSVTNENTRRIYAGLFPAAADRIEVIPPLLQADVGERDGTKLFADDGRIRLVFVGTLHPSVRTPQHVLAAFEKLLNSGPGDRLELHFFGSTNRCEHYFDPYRALAGKRLFVHGAVDHRTARRAMAEADVLVNIGNTTTYQLPSKIVEYANAGRPIVNFTTTPEDSSAQLLKTHPAALSLLCPPAEGEREQSAALARFIQTPHAISAERVRAWCRPFQLESIVREYDRLIEQARSRAGCRDQSRRARAA